MTFSVHELFAALQRHPGAQRYVVAYSGGLDSHVLLHAAVALRPRLAPATLAAVHVNHGLSPNADAWARHCAAVCGALEVPLYVVPVQARPRSGEGPEAAARRARYAALAVAMRPGDCLLTAHQRGDQAETLLLQLLRGAGPHGTAAMPECASFACGAHLRPLLAFSRGELHAYAAAAGLRWIEDESNADVRLRRNYLRREIMPRLAHHWPGVERALARAAGHYRDAAALLDETAAADLTAAGVDGGRCLDIRAVAALTPARRRNVLRYWLRERGLPAPAAGHLHQIEAGVVHAARDRTPLVCWPGAEVRRYRDRLYALAPRSAWDRGAQLPWTEPGRSLALPGGGCLRTAPRRGAGIDAEAWRGGPIAVRFRRGGETCRPQGATHHRTLKNLFQERGVPPWERERVPLVYVGAALAAVGDYWVCAPFAAPPGGHGLVLHWERGR